MRDHPQTMAMQQLQGSGDAKDDIVSVLRNRKEFCQYPGEWKWMRSTVPDHDCQRAADRIEALENENRELRKRLGENDDDRRS